MDSNTTANILAIRIEALQHELEQAKMKLADMESHKCRTIDMRRLAFRHVSDERAAMINAQFRAQDERLARAFEEFGRATARSFAQFDQSIERGREQ